MFQLIENQGYQYVAMGFAGLFLVPQVWRGYKTKMLKDVSSTSMVFIVIGSLLWGFYMWEIEKIEYAGATIFVGFNALLICMMQFYFWCTRVKDHMKSLDAAPTGPIINIAAEQPHIVADQI